MNELIFLGRGFLEQTVEIQSRTKQTDLTYLMSGLFNLWTRLIMGDNQHRYEVIWGLKARIKLAEIEPYKINSKRVFRNSFCQ